MVFRSKKHGFTLVEIMVVVAIIVVLTSIAIPSYIGMRKTAKRGVCISNLRQIETAIERWSIIENVDEGEPLNAHADEIYVYIHGDEEPQCPSGGKYLFKKLGDTPQVRCNVEGHVYISEE